MSGQLIEKGPRVGLTAIGWKVVRIDCLSRHAKEIFFPRVGMQQMGLFCQWKRLAQWRLEGIWRIAAKENGRLRPLEEWILLARFGFHYIRHTIGAVRFHSHTAIGIIVETSFVRVFLIFEPGLDRHGILHVILSVASIAHVIHEGIEYVCGMFQGCYICCRKSVIMLVVVCPHQ